MCYYNEIKVSKQEYIRLMKLEKELNEAFTRSWQGGFDYGDWPIILPTDDGKDFTIEMAHWELIAPWIKNKTELVESRKKYTTLNATGENLLTGKIFKNAALKHRCLVLSSGFFEWRHITTPGQKKPIAYPYYISLKNQPYFFMAGVSQPWVDTSTGEVLNTFAIVTTAANTLMEQIHNTKKRMPVILPETFAAEWLQPNLSESRIAEIAQYQINAEVMQAWPISKNFRQSAIPNERMDYPELSMLF